MDVPKSISSPSATASTSAGSIFTTMAQPPGFAPAPTLSFGRDADKDQVFAAPQEHAANAGPGNIGFSFMRTFQEAKEKPQGNIPGAAKAPVKTRLSEVGLKTSSASPFSFVKTFHHATEVGSDMSAMPGKTQEPSYQSEATKSRPELAEQASKHPTAAIKRRHPKSNLFSKALADVSLAHQKTNRQLEASKRRASVTEDHIVLNPDEIRQLKTIVCVDLPEKINDRDLLFEHFSRFGKVVRLRCNLKKETAVIEFENHDSAAAAKQRGTRMNDRTLQIFWSQKASKKSPQKEQAFTSEVDEELKAMAGSIEEPHLLTRPEELMKKVPDSLKSALHKPRSTASPSRKKTDVATTQAVSKKVDVPASKEAIPVTDTEESLMAELSKPASTVNEKFSILDARDKLMRLRQKKQSDISSAKAIMGVCPDMCPEKERYCRSFKSGLSVFEIKKVANCSVPDHISMIKEYSRSSADQEEPLPHELRPAFVLVATMNHLLCNVMNTLDEGSASTGDWYDFIWNRTRAIRKDITQQHMCDLTSVELVEKCARFHIACAAALCEEDSSVFDFKINDENLTKCLQTLKHFYHDLALKGIDCPNEAEFRCYDVLLNLNEGDILRQVQKLHPKIWASPEVKFAIKAFGALNSNNYVQFFRMVEAASYLNSCILHRYFPQVRSKAIMVITKAFCPPNHSGLCPLGDLVRLLSFENEEEADSFCTWLGLETKDRCVVLNRSMFSSPSGHPPIFRSKKLVDSKKHCSLAEVVNAGPLPPNPLPSYVPHNSFNAEGYLNKEAYDASDQIEKVLKQKMGSGDSDELMIAAASSHEVSLTTEPPPERYDEVNSAGMSAEQEQDEIDHHVIEDVADLLTTEVVDQEVRKFSAECIAFLNAVHVAGQEFIDSQIKILLRELCQEVITEEKRLLQLKQEEARRRQQLINTLRENAMHKIVEELMNEVVEEETIAESQKVLSDFLEEQLQKMSVLVTNDLFAQFVAEEIKSLSLEVMNAELEVFQEKLRVARRHSEKKIMARCFHRWQKLCLQRRQLEQARQHFPPCPPMVPNQELLKHNRKRKSLEVAYFSNKKVSKILDARLCINLLEEEVSWSPLQLEKIVVNALADKCKRSRQNSLRWTLTFMFPCDDHASANAIKEWLHVKFTGKHLSSDDIDNMKKELVSVIFANSLHVNEVPQKLQIQVKSLWKALGYHEFCKLEEDKMLADMSCILVVIPMTPSPEEAIRKCEEQIRLLLKQKAPCPPVPICFLVFQSHDSKESSITTWHQKLKVMLEERFSSSRCSELSSLNVILVKSRHGIEESQKLEEAVSWLAKNTSPFPDVVSKDLKLYLQEGLLTFAISPISDHLSELRKKGFYQQDVRALVDLYNSAVEHLARVASSPSVMSISWCFDQEEGADWNAQEKLEDLKALILSLTLPADEELSEIIAGNDTEDDVFSFVLQVVQHSACDKSIVISRTLDILERSKRFMEAAGHAVVPPWADIIFMLSSYLLELTVRQQKDFKEPKVYFVDNEYWDFSFPESWIHYEQESMSLDVGQNYGADDETELCKSGMSYDDSVSKPPQLSSSNPLEAATFGAYLNFQRQAAEEQEKSKEFSNVLSQVLEDGKSVTALNESLPSEFLKGKSSMPDNVEDSSDSQNMDTGLLLPSNHDSLEARLSNLKSRLNKLKAANRVFTNKLQNLAFDGNVW